MAMVYAVQLHTNIITTVAKIAADAGMGIAVLTPRAILVAPVIALNF